MVECSMCSLLRFLLGCVCNSFVCIFNYRILVFGIAVFIVAVVVSNVLSSKFIRDVRGRKCMCSTPGKGDFSYDGADNGPHSWRCPGTNQSPINIVDGCVQKFPIRELLIWNHYGDIPRSVILENTGHTVVLRAKYDGNTPTVGGADLLASYTFVELRFRWSMMGNDGSEHMLNNRKFPLELQAMHRTGPTSKRTSSYDLLMIAYFFEISANNQYLDPLVENLHLIQKPGSKIEIGPFPLSYLCYSFRSGFYSYGGSLTEPPCYQGAEWFIFPEPMAISERQLYEFRQLLSADGETRIKRNSRPVQNLGGTRLVNLNQYNPTMDLRLIEETPECEQQAEDEESC